MPKTGLYVHGHFFGGIRRIQPIGGARSKTAKHRILFRSNACQEFMDEYTKICVDDDLVLIDCKCDVRRYAFIDTAPGKPHTDGDYSACVFHMVHSKQIRPVHYDFSDGWEVWSPKEKYQNIEVKNERWRKMEAGTELKIVGLHSWYSPVP